MFEKINYNNQIDIKVSDKLGNSFFMHFAKNLDLYWIPEDFKKASQFVIDENDEILFHLFEKLFEKIEQKQDSIFSPSLVNNRFTFVSEDCHEDDAHSLIIEKQNNEFVINFLRNENHSVSHFPKRGCNICFCNSGSRVPKIETLFMQLYIHLVNSDLENISNLNLF